MTDIFTTIDVPGSHDTSVNGVNNLGQLVGDFTDAAGHTHGFLDSGGSFTTLDIKGATSTVALGINNLGAIVGHFIDAAGIEHGFLDRLGAFTTIDMPGQAGTSANAINDAGEIVGDVVTSGAHLVRQAAFKDVGGHVSIIAVPGFPDGPPAPIGGTYLTATGVNDRGWITIDAHNAPGSFSGAAFIDKGGRFTAITPPGAVFPPNVGGLNKQGQLVGGYGTASGAQHGYVDKAGHFTNFDVPGASLTTPAAINDQGEVVGSYFDSSGQSHGFIAVAPASVLGAARPGFLRAIGLP